MPHPRRATGEVNVPRFSELVGNSSPYLPEPAANTTLPAPPAKRLPFSPRVAAYTLAFVATIVGGIYLGATSRDMMEQWEVRILFFIMEGVVLTTATETMEIVFYRGED